MEYYIGWDVGTWKCRSGNKKSCDALVVMDESGIVGHHRENLSKSLVLTQQSEPETKAKALVDSWFSQCGLPNRFQSSDSYFIAIDTPLGWPAGCKGFLDGKLPDEWEFCGEQPDIANPLLFRRTERNLDSGFSVVTHSIGNQSTKGMALIKALCAKDDTWGVWESENITLLETYPTACLRSAAFVEWMTSLPLERDIREWYRPVNKELRRRETKLKKQGDTFDAAVCACLAKAFSDGSPELVSPPGIGSDNEKAEGWIFYPAGDDLIHKSLAENHSAITNSMAASTFGEAVKAFQAYVSRNSSKKSLN
ncbi:DUF429 domain-containing protein [Candidatus Laterigemmans baculatus]|uniref:DUF429 domain-containing protein n=1 Tax=Candidatus Laterigemmans baculatus TaxID=2770505 RepID=UPI0013DD0905|nr:DUF429 domain-containing protein [Candidatus Laterigemmans baculatus]